MTRMKTVAAALAATLLAFPAAPPASAAQPGVRTERVHFAKGANSASFAGRLQGDAGVDYVVRADAGQTLAVHLEKSNPQNYFNVLPPESIAAMYVGQTGEDYRGMLPADGDYTIRVYLMRPAARRNEASDYRISISVTGKPLAPNSAISDALLHGTGFHASAKIGCVPFLETTRRECEAFVVRRGFDGTATVEIPQPSGDKRRILFIAGRPVASDSQDPITFTHERDVSHVAFGTDERYEIPDALLTGG